MKRLNVFSVFELGITLNTLDKLLASNEAPAMTLYDTLNKSGILLSALSHEGSFRSSLAEANRLHTAISTVLLTVFLEANDTGASFRADLDLEGNVDTRPFVEMRSALQAFWYIFQVDTREAETYSVIQKPAHNLATLLHAARLYVHESIRPFVQPLALTELDEAGRCLALEAYTASGFHALRAVEVVVYEYYKTVSGKDKELRSWYDYIDALTDLEKTREDRKSPYPSPKASAMIDRMRQLDRNPLMHPRESLDEMGADNLFSLSILTITELAKDLRDMRPKPEAVQIDQAQA